MRMHPEKVAYWYLRLNGFLQIENFYVHPRGRGGARTDADLLAVRFPHRAERRYDDANDIMADDCRNLSLSRDRIDIVIAEVKTRRCDLNGPWTRSDRKNVHRVLAAIGCLPEMEIEDASEAIYRRGLYRDADLLRIRLIAIGSEQNAERYERYPEVRQVVWSDLLEFVFCRLNRYKWQKKDTHNWDHTGKRLLSKAARHDTPDDFVEWARSAMDIGDVSK